MTTDVKLGLAPHDAARRSGPARTGETLARAVLHCVWGDKTGPIAHRRVRWWGQGPTGPTQGRQAATGQGLGEGGCEKIRAERRVRIGLAAGVPARFPEDGYPGGRCGRPNNKCQRRTTLDGETAVFVRRIHSMARFGGGGKRDRLATDEPTYRASHVARLEDMGGRPG